MTNFKIGTFMSENSTALVNLLFKKIDKKNILIPQRMHFLWHKNSLYKMGKFSNAAFLDPRLKEKQSPVADCCELSVA